MSEEVEKEKVYLISIQKLTAMSGESIQCNFNIPFDSTEEEITKACKKVCNALDERLIESNEKVIAITEATKRAYESLGVETEDSKPNGKTH